MKNFLHSGPGILLILLLISNFLNGGLSDPKSYFLNMLLSLPGIVIGLSFHEFGHAFVSSRLGDPTPARQGRVTLNPLAHMDPFGFICLLFCGFGWGIPVEIDNRYYRHPRRDELLVSLAGVAMNALLAIVFAFLARGFLTLQPLSLGWSTENWQGLLFQILFYVILINLTLMIFNLIPVPPLDGFGILTELFDLRRRSWYASVYRNGWMILMLLLLFGIIDKILYPAIQWCYQILLYQVIMG